MTLIYTIDGDVDEGLLVHTEGREENETSIVHWEEWRYHSDPDGRVVKRSVHVDIKANVFADARHGTLG